MTEIFAIVLVLIALAILFDRYVYPFVFYIENLFFRVWKWLY